MEWPLSVGLLREEKAVLPDLSPHRQTLGSVSSVNIVCFLLQTVGNSGSANGIHQQDKSHKQEVSSKQNVV